MDLNDPKTILVVQIGKIGDMILTTPLFAELKRLFPDVTLKVLASEVNKEIPINHNSVDEVIIYKKNILKDLRLFGTSLKKIDYWIDTKDNFSRTSELLLKVFRPRISFGFNTRAGIFDIDLNEFLRGDHAVDINLSASNYFNKSLTNPERIPSFNIPDEVHRKFEMMFSEQAGRRVLINVSAGDRSRYIQNENWVELINSINFHELTAFSLIGLNRDIEIINYILGSFKSNKEIIIRYVKTESIIETAEVVRRNDVIITPDTSVVHIGSSFNKPVIALYPDVSWNLKKFAPLSKDHEVVISKSKDSVKDIEAGKIFEKYLLLTGKINSGNAESRTRVRKEDH